MNLLYIGGAGRSGSTLVDLLLGNLPDFFSVGEAYRFWEYTQISDRICGCGDTISSCKYWRNVKTQLELEHGIDIEKTNHQNLRFNRTRNILWMNTGIISSKSPDYSKLLFSIESFYHSIHKISGNRIIVDSSKVPSHLALLRNIPDIDLGILHLIRDGRAVAYSWSRRPKQEYSRSNHSNQRMPQRSAYLSMIRWTIENIYLSRVSQGERYIKLHYEDFVRNPAPELAKALKGIGIAIDEDELINQLRKPFQATHSVGGNPIRFSRGKLTIKPDLTWQKNMPWIMLLCLSIIGAPVLHAYGYPILK